MKKIIRKIKNWLIDKLGGYTKEAGVGAICLQRAATDFSLNSQKDNTQNGQIRSTGIFLYETGWNSPRKLEQQNGRPQIPSPPSIFASSLTPICLSSMRVLKMLARFLTSILKSTRPLAVK